MQKASFPRIKNGNKSEILWQELFVITVIIVIQRFGAAISTFTYFCLILWAFRSPKNAIQALFLSWFVAFLNPGIFPDSGGQAMLRWLILFAAFRHIVTLPMNKKQNVVIPKSIISLLPFSVVAALISVIQSYSLAVSLMKLVTFTIGSITVIFLFALTSDQEEYWKSWFTSLFLLILISSLPFFFSGLGYFRNNHGFQGILNHPQAYGTFIAPMFSWFAARFLFEKERSFPVIIAILVAFCSLFATESRTGMLAVFTGLALAVVIGFAKRPEWRGILRQTLGSYPAIIACCFVIFPTILLNLSAIKTHANDFLQKRQAEPKNFIEIYESSRGVLIERSMDNFFENPWTGIGFGIASDPFEFYVRRSELLGIPVGASIEKGFLPSAVLEEVGIIGFLFFIVFIAALARPIIKFGDLPSLWLFFTCLMVNMGEMIFFSFGGIGLYIWLLMGFSGRSREDNASDNFLAKHHQYSPIRIDTPSG